MRYFVPDLEPIAARSAPRPGLLAKLFGRRAESGQSIVKSEHFGGLPFGMEASQWPKCSDCGKSQSLLAQLDHHAERLDLGREGRALLVFQCAHDPGMCSTWESFSGANACLIIEPEELQQGETPLPTDKPPIENLVRITAWRTKESAVPDNLAEHFYSDASYLALGEEILSEVTYSTRLGGVPSWIQGAHEAPRPNWRFLGQLDSMYSFTTRPAQALSWVYPDPEVFEGRTHYGVGPNFGDGGIAYLFLREGEERPEAMMFWQCG